MTAPSATSHAAGSPPRTQIQPPSPTQAHRQCHSPAEGGAAPVNNTGRPPRGQGAGLLAAASGLLFLLAAAQGYVSFRAQYTFVDHPHTPHTPQDTARRSIVACLPPLALGRFILARPPPVAHAAPQPPAPLRRDR